MKKKKINKNKITLKNYNKKIIKVKIVIIIIIIKY